MALKIIADSLGDLPAELTRELGITIIPIFVLFGTESFRDGVDLTNEEFYSRLASSKTSPTTAVPSIGDFVEVYERAADEADEILVLTISHKLSGTFDAATHAAEMIKKDVRIKVVDTLHVLMGEGLLVIEAAKAAAAGASLDEVIKQINHNIPRIEERMAFDTLEYLKRGGRIGAGRAFLGSLLKINPVLGLKDGEIYPLSRERSRTKAIEALYNFVINYSNVEAIAVEDATTPDEANVLAQRFRAVYPDIPIYRSKVGSVLGAHVGPSVISVSVRGDKKA